MTQVTVPPLSGAPRARSPVLLKAARVFYPASAVLLLLISLYGFKDFFFFGKAFPSRPLTPAIRTVAIVHGVSQLGWVLLFIIQPLLIAIRRHKWHRRLGRVGAVFAGVLVVLGYLIATGAARANPPDSELFGMHPPQFLYVPLTAIAVFGVMVGLAVWQRRKADLHRSLMLIATVSTASAAMGRINWINTMVADTVWEQAFGPLHSSVSLGLILLAVRCVLIRRFDLWLAVCVLAMAAVFAAMHLVSATRGWDATARFLMG